MAIQIGSRVQYRAAGKIARLEGMAGQLVWGTVLRIQAGEVSLIPDYRTKPDATFRDLAAVLAISDIVTDDPGLREVIN